METQKSIKDFNYQFRGNINTHIVLTSMVIILPVFFTLLLLSMSLPSTTIGKLISIAIVFTLLIYFFIKFDSESNVILFGDEEIIHIKKREVSKYSYLDLQKVEIVKPRRSFPYVNFKIRGKEFSVSIEKKGYSNFVYDEFAEYLSKKKSGIVITKKGY